MPVVKVPATDLSYHLISFDKDGRERTDDPGGKMSDRIAASVGDAVTDVFLFSHGWRGDIPSALRQYKGWVAAMARLSADREEIRRVRPGFKPLLVGIHWPSEPFGEEDFGDVSFDATAGPALDVAAEVRRWSLRLGLAGNARARAALRTIIEAAADDPLPPRLPEAVAQAYLELDSILGLGSEGPGASPDADRDPFDPEVAYQASFSDEADFGIGELAGNLLSPLKTMSFWTMKKRGRQVGESGGHNLLNRLMKLPGTEGVRYHLMGHSFGCVLVSGAAVGPPGGPGLPRKIGSISLVQGAVSLWSYCKDIPKDPGKPGYFRRLIDKGVVGGPIIVTTSVHDKAVGTWYPKAAMTSFDASFDPTDLPKYGGLGAFGVRGPGIDIQDKVALEATGNYGFQPGRVYNIDCDRVIVGGDKVSGAHSEISVPQVAHAVWEAIIAVP
ncbi:MAG: hypothetical protein ACT4OM_03020 [Actinomycetota bacterium]